MGTAHASWQLCKHFLLISIPVADDSEQKEEGKEINKRTGMLEGCK